MRYKKKKLVTRVESHVSAVSLLESGEIALYKRNHHHHLKRGSSQIDPQLRLFFTAERYLGDQRFSYNQFLSFELQIGEETARPSVVDIIIEGSGQRIATHVFAQSNPVPGVTTQQFAFRLHEDPEYQWSPRLKAQEFISILANVTAIKIRAVYNPNGKGTPSPLSPASSHSQWCWRW